AAGLVGCAPREHTGGGEAPPGGGAFHPGPFSPFTPFCQEGGGEKWGNGLPPRPAPAGRGGVGPPLPPRWAGRAPPAHEGGRVGPRCSPDYPPAKKRGKRGKRDGLRPRPLLVGRRPVARHDP